MTDRDIDQLLQRNWYYQGFNATPALLDAPMRSMFYSMYEMLGFGYTAYIGFFQKDVGYFLYDYADLEHIRDELIERYEKDDSYMIWLRDTHIAVCNRSIESLEKCVTQKPLSAYSLEELYTSCRDVNTICSNIGGVSHAVEGFTLTTEELIRSKVDEAFPHDKNALTILTAPPISSFISVENFKLALIAEMLWKKGEKRCTEVVVAKYPDIQKKIKNHRDSFFWKLNNYSEARSLREQDFIQEIDYLLVHEGLIDKIKLKHGELSLDLEKRDRCMSEIKDVTLRKLLEMNHIIFEIHDTRKECMTKAITYLDMFFREIAKRHALPLRDLRYILFDEFEQLPQLAGTLHARRAMSVYVATKQGQVVFDGEMAKRMIATLTDQNQSHQRDILYGHVASPGKVTGKVKVCRGIDELGKIENGDILVACMTQPEFVPAMKKASAVITDEGGLTCHAAILSRELDIPCVIGTKIATRVFSDGDMVEVDASRGVVRKLI